MIEYGYCECGCGNKTNIAINARNKYGHIKGKPVRFIAGHQFKLSGQKNHNWKGDKVGYRALHLWIEDKLGKPNKCVDCGTTNQNKRYEWANISGEYRRDFKDWKRVCVPCHRILDSPKKGEEYESSNHNSSA